MSRGKKYLLHTLEVGALQTNCYLLTDAVTKDTLIIDPGGDAAGIVALIEGKGHRPVGIVNTHGHADHIGANGALKKKYRIPVAIHRDERSYLADPALNGSGLIGEPMTLPEADVVLVEGQTIAAGALALTVIHTPGHTPGGICLAVEDLLFTGDTLFCGTVGRTDLPGGSEPALLRSLEKFRGFAPGTLIFPGHGNSCTLKAELVHNPFLSGAPRP